MPTDTDPSGLLAKFLEGATPHEQSILLDGADIERLTPDRTPCSCTGLCNAAVLRPEYRCVRGDCAGVADRRLLGHDGDFDVVGLIPTVAAPDLTDCAFLSAHVTHTTPFETAGGGE